MFSGRERDGCINILVNDTQEAVLGDFGLSKIDNDFFTSMASTMQHGCTRWQAPELLFPPPGEIPSTSWATDMWSFGMVVLELFTECLPFAKTAVDSAVIIDIYHGRKPDRPVKSEVRGPGLSDRVWACVEKCWEKSPFDRPRASILVSQLADELGAESITPIEQFSHEESITEPVPALSNRLDSALDVQDRIMGLTFKHPSVKPPNVETPIRRSPRSHRSDPPGEVHVALPTRAFRTLGLTDNPKLLSRQLGPHTSGPVEEYSKLCHTEHSALANRSKWTKGIM
ncbi:kinase-like protein [Rickenella mellea]|uniref:Kinase-like protein n=1 Tax=Rickenella mellea TaxID=50990 RepID=A0A4Y7PUJ8_9AGAM|nr:kinase-like protein [Rickenella mellea]